MNGDEWENGRWDEMMVVHAYGRLHRASGLFGGRTVSVYSIAKLIWKATKKGAWD